MFKVNINTEFSETALNLELGPDKLFLYHLIGGIGHMKKFQYMFLV